MTKPHNTMNKTLTEFKMKRENIEMNLKLIYHINNNYIV